MSVAFAVTRRRKFTLRNRAWTPSANVVLIR